MVFSAVVFQDSLTWSADLLPCSVTASLVVTPSLPPSSQRSLPPEVVAEAVERLKDSFLKYLEGNVVSGTISTLPYFGIRDVYWFFIDNLFSVTSLYFSLSLSQTEATMSSHQLFSGETFMGGEGLTASCDSLGDLATKTLSEMVLNDQPAQDPRWGDTRGTHTARHFTEGSDVIV